MEPVVPGVKIIVAVARNRVIGRDGRLPWKIPEDWNHFLESTRGGSLVLGRRCFEELVDTGALKDGTRRVFIVSTTRSGPDCFPDFPSALEAAKRAGRTIWICGGERIYAEAMPVADELILTLVDADFDGDTRFPEWSGEFTNLHSERASRHGSIPLYFRVYRRRERFSRAECV
ncbi:MAG: dihydrofolate reductase [Opitutales bacterium]|nr:dihydrofolate reductase [Opitutales bacterium]